MWIKHKKENTREKFIPHPLQPKAVINSLSMAHNPIEGFVHLFYMVRIIVT